MSYRLGVDVGGTFTDLLLIDEESGATHTAKVPSTPEDSSIGVLNGVARICSESSVDPAAVNRVMHGTTVATNAVLTARGARVGLVTTRGYKHTLQVARSFCPGGLGGWVSYVKKPLLAPLELTIEADERMAADGSVVSGLDEAALRRDLQALKDRGEVEALTICFINAYVNGEHEVQAREIAQEVFGVRAHLHFLGCGSGDAGIRAYRNHGGQFLRAPGGLKIHQQPAGFAGTDHG